MEPQEAIRRKPRGGISAERELVLKLWKLGLAVIRGPASGAKVKRSIYPDIVALKNRHIFVIEVKKRSKLDHIYIDRRQIEKLKEFARRAGGEPLIAVKISGLRIWKAIPLANIEDVSTDKVKINKKVIEEAEDIISYINKRINMCLKIDKFNE